VSSVAAAGSASQSTTAGGEPTAVSYWPPVYKDDWCSEFKKG